MTGLTDTPPVAPPIRGTGSVLPAVAVGTPLAALAALSVVNSFIGHMTPDTSVYLLDARTFVETLNRFTLSWENKGIMLTFFLALPVRVLGATMAAAALAQLCAYVVGFCFFFFFLRSYVDRWSSTLLVLLAACVVFSSHIWGGRSRPEDFALACCTGCLYAGLRAKPRWWIAGGAMTAVCLFLKITLVLAPGAMMLAAAVADAVKETSAPSGKRWTVSLSVLARDLLWVLLGFAAVAGATVGWIAVFDDLAQCYRQTVQWPIEYRGGPGFQLTSLVNVLSLLEQGSLSFLFAGCIPGLIYGWFRGFRREAFLAGVLLLVEFVRISVEGKPYPYLATIIVAPMLLGAAFFGCARKHSSASMLAWIAPLYLLAPLLIPTIRDQVKTFELRAMKRLPAPYEYLAQQMRGRYRPGERIFVNTGDEQILLFLNAPRPFPILYGHFGDVSEEERDRTLKQYEEQPPDWIIRSDPEHSPVTFATLGNVDEAYHVYLPPAASIGSVNTPSRAGSSLALVGSISRQYTLEVDTGYLQAWHLLKDGA